MTPSTRDKILAGSVTAVLVALVLLLLFCSSVSWNREALAQYSNASDPEDELFLDPELMELGEDEATAIDEAAPAPIGEPEPAETESNQVVIPGDNPQPAPVKEKLNTQTKPAPVQATSPTVSDKEKSKIASAMAGSFSSQNGKDGGNNATTGSGGTGVGVAGNAQGRSFLGCNKPDVTLRNKVTVTVRVVVNEDGNVTEASYLSGNAPADIRNKCVAAAKSARWSKKRGATASPGTITFTITPK